MKKVDFYSTLAVKKGVFGLPKIFDGKTNLKLLAQALRVYEDRAHPRHAKVKTRAQISISTRKIYRQKGTGYARHGAKSAPIFVGGGVAHGPKGVKRVLNLPGKIKRMSLEQSLALKFLDNKVVFVDNLSKLSKTKDAASLINKLHKSLNLKKFSRTTVVYKGSLPKIFRNIKNTRCVRFSDLNALQVLKGGILIFERQIFELKKEVKKTK